MIGTRPEGGEDTAETRTDATLPLSAMTPVATGHIHIDVLAHGDEVAAPATGT